MVFLLTNNIKGKKAVEWPVVMIYVVFVALMMIMGLFMVLNVAKVTSADADRSISELKFTLLADRIINSADCLAWDEPFTDIDGSQKFQVRPGVIDRDKFRLGISDCIGNKRYYIELKDLEAEPEDDWGLIIDGLGGRAITIQDVYFVQIHRAGFDEFHNGLLTIGLVKP